MLKQTWFYAVPGCRPVPTRGDLRLSPFRRRRTSSKAGGWSRPAVVTASSSTSSPRFAAMSVAIGSSAAGASHLHRHRFARPAVHGRSGFNASGLGLPIVMTVANAPSAHRSTSGTTIYRFALNATAAGFGCSPKPTGRSARSAHQASGWRREVSLPVMVCMDGFILTHATSGWTFPQEQVDAFPTSRLRTPQVLDPKEPVSIGAMVGPEAFEVRYLAHAKHDQALERIPKWPRVPAIFGRQSGGLTHTYRRRR